MFDRIINGVIAIGSMFLSTISGINAEFIPIEVFAKGESVHITTSLINCFSEDLDEIFNSGQPVKFNYLIQVYTGDSDIPFIEHTIYRELKFQLLDQNFLIHFSEDEKTSVCENYQRAQELLSSIREYAIFSNDLIKEGQLYRIKVTASLDKIFLPEIGQEINLMYYWNSIKPDVTSELFSTEIFTK